MTLKSIITIFTVVIVVAVMAGCSSEEEPEADPIAASAIQQPRVVSAEAFVVPPQEADLAFEIGGRVVAINVKEGDEVEPGDTLAQLDSSTQEAVVAEAEAGVAQAEMNVAQARSGVTEAEADLTSRAASLAESEANLARVTAGPTEEQIAQARAGLTKAEAVLADVITGSTAEDIAQAEAAVQTARAQLNEILADAREEDLQAASATLLQTEVDVRKAQADYDRVRYGNAPDIETTGTALEKATLAYENAQANLDKLVNGATEEQIATGRAGVAEAEAALAKVLAGATPEQIAQAQADVLKAEADLAHLLAGSTAEEIAQAQAQVEIYKANLEAARERIETAKIGVEAAQSGLDASLAQLASALVERDKTTITAPFAGEISSLNVDVGEIVQSGTSIIAMGDGQTSGWQIETDDLTEIDVVDVQPGAKVNISVDALPEADFKGEVVRITPKSETKAGDVTYTVLIDITAGDTSPLKWGMTTFVDIEADRGIAR
jgi:HlyD family secretion protein